MLRKTAALCILLAATAVCQRDTRPVSAIAVPKREAPLRALIAINEAATGYFSWLKRFRHLASNSDRAAGGRRMRTPPT